MTHLNKKNVCYACSCERYLLVYIHCTAPQIYAIWVFFPFFQKSIKWRQHLLLCTDSVCVTQRHLHNYNDHFYVCLLSYGFVIFLL
ncbi:hypothetical protein FKM82_009462 [Ascaphus truei]